MTSTQILNLATTKNLLLQYNETTIAYYLYLYDGLEKQDAVLYKLGYEIPGINVTQNTTDLNNFLANFKPTIDNAPPLFNRSVGARGDTLVHDEDVFVAITGNVGNSNPVGFTEILDIGGKRRKKKASVTNGKRVLLLEAIKPGNKTWFITKWDGSGQGKGFYELILFDATNKTETTEEPMDSATGWTKSGKVLTLVADTVNKTEGTASLAATLKFQDKGIQNAEKITKTFSPTKDWSTYDFLALDVRGDAQNSNVTIGLKVYQGGSNYTFADQNISVGAFGQIIFDLTEITAFDLTAVDKIDILFYENIDLKNNVTINIDDIHGISGIQQEPLDYFYAGAYHPNNAHFPEGAALKISGSNKSLVLYVTNTDSGVFDYEVGLWGREL